MRRRSLLAIAGVGMAWSYLRAARAGERMRFEEMYKASGVLGLEMSDKLIALNGKPVEISGFMAPPLKPDSKFFVLTRTPVSVCPFCSSDADWPNDIVVIYLKGNNNFYRDGTLVKVVGKLEIGSKVDTVTGFVSLLRLADASVVQA